MNHLSAPYALAGKARHPSTFRLNMNTFGGIRPVVSPSFID